MMVYLCSILYCPVYSLPISHKVSWRKEEEIRVTAYAYERDLAAEQVGCRDNDWSMLQPFLFSCMLQVGVAEGAIHTGRRRSLLLGRYTVPSCMHLESLQAHTFAPSAKISLRCRVFHDGLELVAIGVAMECKKEWCITREIESQLGASGCLHVSELGDLLWKLCLRGITVYTFAIDKAYYASAKRRSKISIRCLWGCNSFVRNIHWILGHACFRFIKIHMCLFTMWCVLFLVLSAFEYWRRGVFISLCFRYVGGEDVRVSEWFQI